MRLARTRKLRLAVGEEGVLIFAGAEERRFDWPDEAVADPVEDVVGEIRALIGGPGRARASVVLLPPLVDVRRVELPALRSREVTAVLENHASRYFPRRLTDVATGWVPLKDEGDGTVVMAAAAEAEPVSLLLDALEREGHMVVGPVPAHVAWVRAAKREASFRGEVGGSVCVGGGRGWVILELRRDRLVRTTWFAPKDLSVLADRLRGEMRNGASVVVVGEGASADDLSDALRVGTPREPIRLLEDPVRLAARFAASSRRLTVLPHHVRERRAGRRRRAQIVRFVAAGLLLLIAAGLNSWRLSRELMEVRASRARHAAEVQRILAIRDEIAAVDRWLKDARQHVAGSVEWSEWLIRVAEALPAGTHLDRIAGRSGELEISGSAPSSADVLSAIQAVPGVIAVDLTRPVRRVQGLAGSSEDQFSFVVRLPEPSVP